MTNQELFDFVVTHDAKQGKRAGKQLDKYTYLCFYRTPEGLKCNAGCLIKDEFYNPNLEYKSVCCEVSDALIRSGIESEQLHIVSQLQTAHDDSENVESIKNALNLVATIFKLDNKLVDTITQWS